MISQSHTQKTTDLATTTNKNMGELRCPERISSSCSTNDTLCLNGITRGLHGLKHGFCGSPCCSTRYNVSLIFLSIYGSLLQNFKCVNINTFFQKWFLLSYLLWTNFFQFCNISTFIIVPFSISFCQSHNHFLQS